MTEPTLDLAHLGHIELMTPRPAESLAFFTDVFGLSVSGYEDGSVYLRAWGDYEFHSLKLTAAAECGVGHFAWRARSGDALDRRVAAFETAGLGLGWVEGDLGHGRAFRARGPEGREIELYYDTRWNDAPHEAQPAFPRGCNVRRIDHLTLAASDMGAARRFFEDALGLRTTERVEREGLEAEFRLTSNNKICDLALTNGADATPASHRLAYVVDGTDDVRRAAHVCIEHSVSIETGPRHPVHRTVFAQVQEPGGNRLEICCPGAELALAPDWRTIVRIEGERPASRWGLRTVST